MHWGAQSNAYNRPAKAGNVPDAPLRMGGPMDELVLSFLINAWHGLGPQRGPTRHWPGISRSLKTLARSSSLRFLATPPARRAPD